MEGTRMTAAHRTIVALHNIHRPTAELTPPETKITERAPKLNDLKHFFDFVSSSNPVDMFRTL